MNQSVKKPRYQRNFGLDLLRSTAITVVLINHGFFGFFVNTGISQWQGWRAALSASAVFSIEWLFVLSGFLIGSMMIRSFERRADWWGSARDFWLRRWFRTIPNYYLFLLANIVLAWWGIEEGRFAWSFVVFSQNLAWAETKPLFFSESWSLALDEWFYFVMPLLLGLVILLLRAQRKVLFWAAALILILIPNIVRFASGPTLHFFDWDETVRRVTIMHLDATGWGVVAAILSKWHADWWNRWRGLKAFLGFALTLGAVLSMCLFILKGWHVIWGGWLNDTILITAPCLGVVLFLPWLSSIHPKSSWIRGLAARVGDYSYSVYLSHFPVMMVLVYFFSSQGWNIEIFVWWAVFFWVVMVFLVSMIVFHNFEKPISDLREKFTTRVQAGPFMTNAVR